MTNEQTEPDVFGHMLLDTAAEENNWEITELDNGLVSARSAEVYFDGFDRWPLCEQIAMRMVRGKVLDIGCGAGKYSLHLQNQGHDVVAVDSSRGAVITARHRGVRQALIMPPEALPGELGLFDSVIILGGVFTLLGPAARLQNVLAHLHSLTKDDALILATVGDPHRINHSKPKHSGRRTRLRNGLPQVNRIRLRYRQEVSPWRDYLLLSEEKLAEVVQFAGWELQDTVADNHYYLAVMRKGSDLPVGTFRTTPTV